MSVQSVNRALDIITLFTAAQSRWGIAEMSKALGLNQPTVHALVKTMVERGFLLREPETRKYLLGLKLYEQGVISAGSLRINQIGTGPAYKLLNNTDLTVRLALLDGDQVVVTLNLSPQLQLQTLQIGPRTPAYCSAMGKAILSKLPQEKLKTYLAGTKFRRFTAKTITDPKALLKDLEETRLRGYSLDREEYLIGFTCAGAPIYDHNGQPVAAASISGAPVFLKDERFSDRVHELIQTTNEISRLLGHIPGATASTGR